MITAQSTAQLVRSQYDLYNQRDFSGIPNFVTSDVTIVNIPFAITFNGPAGYREFLDGWATGFPDSKVAITQLIASEDAVAVEFTARGTHQGPLKGPGITLPPTGRTMDMKFCQVWRVKDGKIAEMRIYFDSATLLRQLGITT